jgi:hypothetical protein
VDTVKILDTPEMKFFGHYFFERETDFEHQEIFDRVLLDLVDAVQSAEPTVARIDALFFKWHSQWDFCLDQEVDEITKNKVTGYSRTAEDTTKTFERMSVYRNVCRLLTFLGEWVRSRGQRA